ncbi:MAG: tetratricopeptide repeat protein, partial [Deltaproteobacteria bacterium]|nr:tetratricopeptide repeat protein [Deltaproteobacteria bacterium]
MKNIQYLVKHRLWECVGIFLVSVSISACAVTGPGAPSTAPQKGVPVGKMPLEGKDRIHSAYSHFMMASLHKAHGRNENARDELVKALESDPYSAYLNREMAVILRRLKDFKGAIEYARKCLEIAPDDIQNRFLLAEIYALSGDEDAAVKEYEEILSLDSKQQRVRLILTTLLIKKRKFEP